MLYKGEEKCICGYPPLPCRIGLVAGGTCMCAHPQEELVLVTSSQKNRCERETTSFCVPKKFAQNINKNM
jgi:hypothetical protein